MHQFRKTLEKIIGFSIIKTQNRNALESTFTDLCGFFDQLLILNKGIPSPSQLRQDVLALLINNWKENGFFVEFGAADGLTHSNTYILEKHYNWDGILCEPCSVWLPKIKSNRSCTIEHLSVWHSSNMRLDFETKTDPELSHISDVISAKQKHRGARTLNKEVTTTITLEDLLDKHNAPSRIDFLSVDVEGAELEVFKNFDFSKYEFSLIAVEHNYRSDEIALDKLFIHHGYNRILPNLSQWDAWYVPQNSQSLFNK